MMKTATHFRGGTDRFPRAACGKKGKQMTVERSVVDCKACMLTSAFQSPDREERLNHFKGFLDGRVVVHPQMHLSDYVHDYIRMFPGRVEDLITALTIQLREEKR